jgi:hypothetical protein
LLLLAWLVLLPTGAGGCDDDDVTNDSGIPDSTTGVDATQPDATQPDATQPDAVQPDATQPDATQPDAAQPDATQPDATQPDATGDTAATVDGGSAGTFCKAIIGTCAASATWPKYVKPFTLGTCSQVTSCVESYYSGSCQKLFKSLVSCAGGISSAAQCDTKCLAEIALLTTSCSCPAPCGVPCT